MGVYYKHIKGTNACMSCRMYKSGVKQADGKKNMCMVYFREIENIMSRPKWCPSEDIITPHGRLIDGFKLHKKIEDRINNGDDMKPEDYLYEIDLAPTIIEGEEI